jgi:hypothetical protein
VGAVTLMLPEMISGNDAGAFFLGALSLAALIGLARSAESLHKNA